jgi:hypothetical protein
LKTLLKPKQNNTKVILNSENVEVIFILVDSFEVRVLLNEKTRGGLLYKPYEREDTK